MQSIDLDDFEKLVTEMAEHYDNGNHVDHEYHTQGIGWERLAQGSYISREEKSVLYRWGKYGVELSVEIEFDDDGGYIEEYGHQVRLYDEDGHEVVINGTREEIQRVVDGWTLFDISWRMI